MAKCYNEKAEEWSEKKERNPDSKIPKS